MTPDPVSSESMSGAGREAPQPSESDEMCLRRFAGGDHEALVVLVARHQAAVNKVLLGLWPDSHEVEDLCQEVFLRLILSPPRDVRGGTIRPWLLRTAVNLVRDRARRKKVRGWLRLGTAAEVEASRQSRVPNRGDAEQHERVDRLRREIARLRPTWQEVVVLRDLMDLSPDESAEILGLSQRVVNDRLYRARRHLAKRLAE